MVRRLITVACMVVFAACGDGNGITPPKPVDAQGTWSGNFPANGGTQDVSLTMKLTEASGKVTGDGTLVTSQGSFPLTITGTYDSPRLALAVTTPGFDLVSLVALVGETSMTGTIGGGGFGNDPFTLDRQ